MELKTDRQRLLFLLGFVASIAESNDKFNADSAKAVINLIHLDDLEEDLCDNESAMTTNIVWERIKSYKNE